MTYILITCQPADIVYVESALCLLYLFSTTDTPMKKKPGNPARPRASRQVTSCHQSSTEPGRVCDVPPNSESVSGSSLQSRRLAMSHHGQNLLRFLDEDRARQRFCDVSVCVGGKLYSAHKVVLAHGSSYFHAELSKNPGAVRVTLDHVEDSVFQHLLGFMYTSECVVAETALPSLIEAARFLDMMDMLKLLCEEGGSNAVQVRQMQDDTRGSPEVEMTSSDSPAVDTDIQSTSDDQCSTGNPQGCAESSLEVCLAENQADVQQEASEEKERKGATTRRSTRSRRMPSKYQRTSGECGTHDENQRKQNDRTGKKAEKAAAANPDVNEPPQQEEDVVDEVEEEGDISEAVKKKNVQAYKAEKHAGQQGLGAVGRKKQTVGEEVVEMSRSAAGSSTQSPVYPEGLAPVIILNSSKKILQCPKCDKIFDRAGGKLPLRRSLSLSSVILPWYPPCYNLARLMEPKSVGFISHVHVGKSS